ncbi:MAG: hypothetical protein QGI60_05085, partial [archaeon]|nr:hypothetical protein [archaeon]
MSQIQKENSKLCGPEPCNPDLFVISSWEAQLLEKKLFDNLDTHYGSNKELIKKLEGEVSDLQAKIKYLEGIKPTWKGYLNPLVLLGTGLEAVGDLIFEGGKVSISREEYEKQISDEILDLKSQITAINAVVVELGRENSLIGIYSRIREGFKGKTFKEASKEGVIIYAKNSEDPLKGASNNEAVIYAENLAYFSDQSNDPTGTNRLLKMWHGFYNNSTLRGELRKQRMLLGKDFLENIEEANLLYNTIHALEMERDSVLALEIILDKQKYEAEHGKPWREANLIGGIARLIDPGQEEPISKATTLIFNLSRERRGIKKILEQLRTGVPLLDIFETNWNYGPIHRLDYGVPKVINPDLTFLLKGAKKGTEDMEIEAFIGGLDVGTSPVAVGKTIGFTGAPGLLIKAEGEKGSGFTRSVDISFFVDEDYARYFPNPEPTHGFPFNATSNERLNRIVPGKGNLEGVRSGVFETTNPNVLIAIRISKGEKLNVEDIRSSDQIAVVDIKTALFEKSAVSKEKAEELVAYDKHLDMIYKLAEKNGGRAETHRFYLYYYLGADGSARRMDGELMTQGFGHNQGTVKQRVLRNSNIYSSTKFPGLAFRFDWNSKNEELTFYNHYSDLAALWKKQKADSVIAKGVEKEEDKTEDTAKVTEAKKDSLILAGLNNVSVYTQVHVRKMLLEDEKVSDEEFASLLFMTAKRYERFSLWQEALSVYTQIDDTFPSTPQSKLAIAQRAEVDYYVGAGQFVSFLEGLTSIESAVHYVLIAGVVKVIGRVVQLTKVTRVANVAKVQPAAQASEALTTPSKLLTGTTSKWSKVKAFFNYPLEDLIARPIAKGITSYRNFKIARAIRTAEQAPSAIAKVVSKPYAVDVSAAASSKSVQIGEANLRVVRTSKASFYQSPGGSVMVTNDATALADAALKTKKAVAALKYLEKVGRVPTGSANMFKNVGSMLDDALLHATPSVSTGTTLVAVPQSELQALSLFEEAMQPIILTSATGSATTVVQMAEGLAGRTGVFASVWYSSPVVGGEVKALPLLLYKRFLPYEEPLFYKGIGDVTGVPMFVMKESAAFSGTKVLLFETAQGRSFYQAANDLMGLDVEGIFFERFYYPRTTSHVEQLRLVIIHEMTHKWQASLSGTQQDTLLTAFLDHVVLDEKAAALAHLTPDLYLIKANS